MSRSYQHHLPDAIEQDKNMAAISRLLADVAPDEAMPRKYDFGDKDPFGLLEITDAYEYLVEDLLKSCQGITHACLDTDKERKRAYLAQQSIALPPVQISKRHEYQLLRSPFSEGVIFTFQRLGKGYEQAGFQIVENSSGHTILRTLDPEQTPVTDDEAYIKLITLARRFIHQYAEGLNIPVEHLEAHAAREIKKDKMLQKIGRTAVDSNIAVRDVVRRSMRPLRYVALGAAILAPLPGYSSPIAEGSPVSKPILLELGDDFWNSSEHERQGYDAKGYHLPETAQIINNGQTVRLRQSEMTPLLRKQASNAPELDADMDTHYDVYGGLRQLTYLGSKSGDENSADDLDPEDCEDINVTIDPEDGVRVMGIPAELDNRLEMSVSEDSISICNRSDAPIDESKLKRFTIEVVDR